MATKKSLEKQFAELRSKTLRKTNGSEQAIRATFKDLMKDLKHFIADEYDELAEKGKLDYATLQKKGQYAKFLEEATRRLDNITPEVTKEITKLVEEVYEVNYQGLYDIIASGSPEIIKKELAGLTNKEAVVRSVGNSVDKLTLSDTLEYNRVSIVYDIRKQISMGLVNGDRYEEMAKRIANSLDNDYKKAIRIVRTEAHKVQEQGLNDSATECYEAIKRGNSGLVMVKIWHTGQDSRVRDTHAAMEGVMVLADEEFELPSGAVTMTCGNSGVAAEDINCRCYCSYKVMTPEEYEKATGNKVNAPKDKGAEEQSGTIETFDANKYKEIGYSEYKDYAKSAAYNEGLDYDIDKLSLTGDGIVTDWSNMEAAERTHRMSEAQSTAYGAYIGTPNSFTLNEYLRTHDTIKGDMLSRQVELLDEVFSSWEMPKKTVVTRFADENYLEAVFGGKTVVDVFNNVGNVIQEKQYLSTSASAAKNVFSDKKCKLTMYVDEGTKCFPALNYDESEFVFPRGTSYEVLGGDMNKDGQIEIFVRILK